MSDLPQDVTELLEALIDKHGLTHILVGVSLVCFEKAEHLRTNWQDKTSAKAWDADGKTVDKAARLICSDIK